MGTILSPGDLAIVGVNADDPDAFNFVLLTDIEAGTEIFFTDNGVFADGTFRANEGILQYTAPTALAAGTVIGYTDINADFTETDAGFALSTGGDQVIAYQGDVTNPTFIYAVQTNSTQFQSTATSSNTSALPTGLVAGETAVAVGSGSGDGSEFNNSTYNQAVTSGTQAELLVAIGDANNWNGDNSRIAALADGPFTVGAAPLVINEVLVSTTGSDVEFIEIFGEPGTSLTGLSVLNVEASDSGNGVGGIDNRFDLPSDAVIGDNGFYLIGNSLVAGALGVTPNAEIPANFFENSSSTIALVETATITGTSVSGNETVIDAVALQDNTGGTFFYGAPVLGPDGTFYPSAVTRTPDGGAFQLIDAFSPAGANTTPTAGTVAVQPPLINEVYASHTGTDDTEFIELFGAPGTSLEGLSLIVVEGDSGPSIGAIDFQVDFTAADVLGDNGFFLIGNPTGLLANYGVTPNLDIDTNSLENSSFTIALVETSSISGTSVTGGEVVVDTVALTDGGDGDTFFFEAPVVGPDGTFFPAGARRVEDGVDTDTVADWVISDFNLGPANTPTAGTGTEPPPPTEVTKISAIQGSGPVSPLVGSTVTIEAVVVGDFQDGAAGTNGDFNGFFVQEEDTDADSDAATSEGLFIFDGNNPAVDVKVGDLVRVTGTVSEFFGETQFSNVTVEIVDNVDNSGLVTPAIITFPIASTITNSDGALIADLEAYEGMLVTIPQELTVADLFTLGRFGDIGLYADGRLETYTQNNAPSVAGFQAYQDLAVRNTVILDDGSTIQNPATIPFEVTSAPGDVVGQLDANDQLRTGDTITDLTGVVRFSRGSGGSGDEIYRINPTETPAFENTNPRPTEAPDVGGDIKVAAFNVLNFFTTLDTGIDNAGPNQNQEPRGADSATEFDRQLQKLLAAFTEIEADIFGLIELENEFGDQNGDGEFAIGFLVDALNDTIAGANYQYVDPGQGFIDTGDAISVGLIYNANTVNIAAGTNVAILSDALLPGLGVDPGVPVFDGAGTSRAPLAVTFEEVATGEDFTVVVNHFKSKGSPGPAGAGDQDQGDGAAASNQTRLNAAIALDAWLDNDPTGSNDDDVLIIGDLNAYAMEDPIQYLLGQGYEDQVKRFLETGDFEYSFGFPLDLGTSPQVQAFGALDYALATGSLAAQITGAAEWHINADEASVFDYNTEFKPAALVESLFGANPFRSSDHDPIIIGLDLKPSFNIINGTAGRDILTGTEQNDIITGFQGRDRITTGAGNDVIVFTSLLDAGDIITDFEVGADLIDLTELVASLGVSSDDAFDGGYVGFRGGQGATLITIDIDGTAGPGRARNLALVQGVELTATDILV